MPCQEGPRLAALVRTRRAPAYIPFSELQPSPFLPAPRHTQIYGPLVLPLIIVFIITSIETVGDVSATEEASFISTTGPGHERRIRGALTNDSLSSIFSSLVSGAWRAPALVQPGRQAGGRVDGRAGKRAAGGHGQAGGQAIACRMLASMRDAHAMAIQAAMSKLGRPSAQIWYIQPAGALQVPPPMHTSSPPPPPGLQATSLPLTTFAQNNGVISLTAVASRQAGWACALWLFLFGIFAKFGGLITSIPDW